MRFHASISGLCLNIAYFTKTRTAKTSRYRKERVSMKSPCPPPLAPHPAPPQCHWPRPSRRSQEANPDIFFLVYTNQATLHKLLRTPLFLHLVTRLVWPLCTLQHGSLHPEARVRRSAPSGRHGGVSRVPYCKRRPNEHFVGICVLLGDDVIQDVSAGHVGQRVHMCLQEMAYLRQGLEVTLV